MVLHKPKNRKEYIQNLNKTNEMECSIYMNKPPVWNDCKIVLIFTYSFHKFFKYTNLTC